MATTPVSPPAPTSTQTQAQTATQTQSQANTQSTAANSGSVSTSAGQASTYASDHDSVAVGFANPTTAAPVFTKCHESRGGKHVIAGSWGARVTIDSDCQAFEQCMTLARTYVEVGEHSLAVAQLAQCGGQPVPEVQTTALEGESQQYCADDNTAVSTEALDRLLEACQQK